MANDFERIDRLRAMITHLDAATVIRAREGIPTNEILDHERKALRLLDEIVNEAVAPKLNELVRMAKRDFVAGIDRDGGSMGQLVYSVGCWLAQDKTLIDALRKKKTPRARRMQSARR